MQFRPKILLKFCCAFLLNILSGLISGIGFLLFFKNDFIDNLIVLRALTPPNQSMDITGNLSLVLTGWETFVIMLSVSVVLWVAYKVLIISLSRNCQEWVLEESKKSGIKPNSVFGYNQKTNSNSSLQSTQTNTVTEVKKESTTESKLAELKSLKEQGLISEEQYNEAVNKQLDSL